LFITWPAIKSRATRIEFEIPISKTKRFWDGLKEGEIYSTRCRSCGGSLPWLTARTAGPPIWSG